MVGDLGVYIIFLLGILVGGILFNKDFRYKFFKGLRGFLSQIGKGAREYNKKYEGKRTETRDVPKYLKDQLPKQEKPEVQHIYKRVHTPSTCSTCKGSGRVFKEISPLLKGTPGYNPEPIECPECEGEGVVWD